MDSNTGVYLVSWDFSHGEDHDIVIVGQKEGGKLNIVNAFAGEEARDIYKKLSTVKKKVTTNE